MAAIQEKVYRGRDNVIRLKLSEDGTPIDTTALNRAVLIFGGLTVDSQSQGGMAGAVFKAEAGGVLQVKLGKVAGLPAAGNYNARLVVYDAGNTDGLVWVYESALDPLKIEVID